MFSIIQAPTMESFVEAQSDLGVKLRSNSFLLGEFQGIVEKKIAVEQGMLVPVGTQDDIRDILPYIRFANDCHSFNVQLSLDKSGLGNVFLEIVRPIKKGEELLLWFSDDLLAILPMAFLIPSNIQGQKKYVCNRCLATFEYPNPLKLHLTIDCNRSLKYIWIKLKRNLMSSPESPLNLTKASTFNFELTPRRRSCDELTRTCISPTRPLSEPARLTSAFQPYARFVKESLFNNNFSQSLTHFPFEYPRVPSTAELNNHAAQMETLVSNLGKSKQGHLCIYCGKVYSRKYGLKIHIRTHTGFKPLKCKYCLRPFGDPSNLNKHVRLHAEGETPYKCDLCGKILVRKRDLDRHLKSRHMVGEHRSPSPEIQPTSP